MQTRPGNCWKSIVMLDSVVFSGRPWTKSVLFGCPAGMGASSAGAPATGAAAPRSAPAPPAAFLPAAEERGGEWTGSGCGCQSSVSRDACSGGGVHRRSGGCHCHGEKARRNEAAR